MIKHSFHLKNRRYINFTLQHTIYKTVKSIRLCVKSLKMIQTLPFRKSSSELYLHSYIITKCSRTYINFIFEREFKIHLWTMIHKRIISISKHDLLSDLIPRQEGRVWHVRILRNQNSVIPVAFTIKIHPNTTEFFKSSLFLLRKSFCCSSLKIVFFFLCEQTHISKLTKRWPETIFFPTLGWRPTHLGDFHLVSICTTLDCIQFNCSHTFSLDSLQKNFCVVFAAEFYCS